ncbi:MAG: hypothetical protein ACM32J_16085 [Rhizobacter sp.]
MSRLHAELQRLYPLAPAPTDDGGNASHVSPGPSGPVRALVLELARPADWALIGPVWRGVQSELGWPAPAIAVSGTDGLQLWFSLADPLPAEVAHALLQSLRARFMPDAPERRVRCFPAAAADTSQPLHAPRVPAEQEDTGNWSAFVAPDLAPVFADTPWLDIPPSPDGQADLLSRLRSITPAELATGREALDRALASAAAPAPRRDAPAPAPRPAEMAEGLDPHAFLLQVMNNPTVDMALRIEAARALLPYTAHATPPPRA